MCEGFAVMMICDERNILKNSNIQSDRECAFVSTQSARVEVERIYHDLTLLTDGTFLCNQCRFAVEEFVRQDNLI